MPKWTMANKTASLNITTPIVSRTKVKETRRKTFSILTAKFTDKNIYTKSTSLKSAWRPSYTSRNNSRRQTDRKQARTEQIRSLPRSDRASATQHDGRTKGGGRRAAVVRGLPYPSPGGGLRRTRSDDGWEETLAPGQRFHSMRAGSW